MPRPDQFPLFAIPTIITILLKDYFKFYSHASANTFQFLKLIK